MSRFRKVSSKVVHENPWYKVRQDDVIRPDGKPGQYNVIDFTPAAYVVAVTKEMEINLIRLHRYTTDMLSWEVVAGNAEGKDMLEAAKRELMEETGLVANAWEEVGKFQSLNGACNLICHTFVAKDLEQSAPTGQEEEGIEQVQKVSFAKAFAMIKSGEITDSESAMAITQAALHLGIPVLAQNA